MPRAASRSTVASGQPVAVLQAPGDQPVAVAAELAERADDDRGRADAVDVVVAVDGDPPPGRDRRPDPLADLGHRLEQERVVVVGGLEEGARLLDRAVAAADQGDRDRLGEAEPVHQRPRLARSRRARAVNALGALSGTLPG